MKTLWLKKKKGKEKKVLIAVREMRPYLRGKGNSDNSGFPTRNHRGQEQWHDISQVLKEKTVSSEFYIQGKLPQEWRKNQDFLEWLEAKRLCHQ